jgi:transposase-like protein
VCRAPGAFVVALHRQEALGRICRELREIYTAPTLDAAEAGFGEFAEPWRDRYPAMTTTWEQSWGEFVPSLEFPVELRTVVYITMKSSTVGGGSRGLPVGTSTS